MSSYFDTMATCVNDPKQLAALVLRQYGWYLRKLSNECLVRDLERFAVISRRMFEIERRFKEGKLDPSMVVEELHDLAHNLARANIRLRGGRRAMDNPPLPY